MKRTKMSLANIQGKLSRAEMKNIMAGSIGYCIKCNTTCTPTGLRCCDGGCLADPLGKYECTHC